MNTTSLFVEFLVIGGLALLWIGLLTAQVLGVSPKVALESVESHPSLWPFLGGLGYVLGILVDRISDNWCFSFLEYRIRRKVMEKYDGKDYRTLDIRRAWAPVRKWVLEQSGEYADVLMYHRHRVRIVRSTFINSLLTGLMVCISCKDGHSFGVWSRGFLASTSGLIAVTCFPVWWGLTKTHARLSYVHYRLEQFK